MKTALIVIAALPGLAGCTPLVNAYWNKPNKYVELPQHGATPPIATLSLDATRRLVVSQAFAGAPGGRFTCAEPPPDVALNTVTQQLAHIKTPSGTSAELGQTYATLVQALTSGRSTTVEFWRTTSSTYCVLLMNGRTSEAAAYLTAATAAIGTTKDNMAEAQVTAAALTGLIKPIVTQALADDRKAQADAAAKLAAVKADCAKLSEAQQKASEQCKSLVTAAAAPN